MFGLFRGEVGDWGQVPNALGFVVDGEGALRGTWNGAIDLVGRHTHRVVTYTDANGHSRRRVEYYTALTTTLDPSLLMGLTMRPRSFTAKLLGSIFGASDIQTGEPGLDERYDIRAADAELAMRILPGRVAHELLARGRPDATITDDSVNVEYPNYERDVAPIKAGLELVGRVAQALLDARARELAAWEPELRAEWARVAGGWTLDFDPRRARMEGVVRGASVLAKTSYGRGLKTSVHITRADSLGCELSLTRQGGDGFFAKLFRGFDIVVGDPAFDGAFVVKGRPIETVRAVLTPHARAKLNEIHERADLFHVKNELLEVWARGPILAAQNLDEMLKICFETAEALGERPAGGEGPYRGG